MAPAILPPPDATATALFERARRIAPAAEAAFISVLGNFGPQHATEAERPSHETGPSRDDSAPDDERPSRNPPDPDLAPSLAGAAARALEPLTIQGLNLQLLQGREGLRGGRGAHMGGSAGLDPNAPTSATPSREAVERSSDRAASAPANEPAPRAGNPPTQTEQPTGVQPHPRLDATRAADDRANPAPDARPRPETHDGAPRNAPPPSHAGSAAGLPPRAHGAETAPARSSPTPAPAIGAIAAASGRKAGAEAHGSRSTPAQQNSAGGRPADPSAPFAAQLSRGLAAAMSRKDGVVTLRMNPESLGFVRVRLEMQGPGGGMTARFEASTEQARQLLEQSVETLRASLEAKGWESPHVRVELLRDADPAADLLRRLGQQGERFAHEGAEEFGAPPERHDGTGADDPRSGSGKDHGAARPSRAPDDATDEPPWLAGAGAEALITLGPATGRRLDTLA